MMPAGEPARGADVGTGRSSSGARRAVLKTSLERFPAFARRVFVAAAAGAGAGAAGIGGELVRERSGRERGAVDIGETRQRAPSSESEHARLAAATGVCAAVSERAVVVRTRIEARASLSTTAEMA